MKSRTAQPSSGARIEILAVGRLRPGPLAELCAEYRRRIPWSLEVREVEHRGREAGSMRVRREAELLRAAIPARAFCAALDERGTSYDSVRFAEKLRGWRESRSVIAFLIGGADGLAPDLVNECEARLSLGPLTWPHFLVRAMLLEQLYRAYTIGSGHPYHRV
jgi:23S rRNA (pseudouridine1915-N3)-methyltransferase